MDVFIYFGIILLTYAIGSIPSGYLLGRLYGIDIFEVGSGNMGANNILRTLGVFAAVMVFLADAAKGLLCVWLGRALAPDANTDFAAILAAIAAVAGHNWSWLASVISGKVRGGKGASTTAGTWLALMPWYMILIPTVILVLVAWRTRYMSLAVLVGTTVGTFLIAAFVLVETLDPLYSLYAFIPVMVFYRHKDNIKRLLAGNERRIGEKA